VLAITKQGIARAKVNGPVAMLAKRSYFVPGPVMDDTNRINFDAPAILRKWPSLNGERISAAEAARAPSAAPAALDGPFSGSFRGSGSDETNLLATKPFLVELRRRLETMLGYLLQECFKRRGFDHAHDI
jgi:hypothetical protein